METKILPFFEFCKRHILDELEKMEGEEVYMCDLGSEMCEREHIDDTFTYSTGLAIEYLKEWFYDAGEFSDYEQMQLGQRSNPFKNVERFLVNMLEEGVRTILARCNFVDRHWNEKRELTPYAIKIIKRQVNEQTNEKLF